MRKVELEAVQAIHSYVLSHKQQDQYKCPWMFEVAGALRLLWEGKPAEALRKMEFWEGEERRKWEAEG